MESTMAKVRRTIRKAIFNMKATGKAGSATVKEKTITGKAHLDTMANGKMVSVTVKGRSMI
jgi:hypothetical protein